MDPITQKLFMASSAPETFPGLMVEDVFGTDVYYGMGSAYDSPFASGFTTNYGKDGYYSTYFAGGGNGGGVNGYIDFTADSGFDLAGDFTIEMWVKGSYQPGTVNLFQLDGPTGNTQHQNLQIRMQHAAGNINVMNTFNTDGNSNGLDLIGSTNLMDGNWHHICVMRYSNGTLVQFIDGNSEQYSTNGGTYFNPNGGSPRIRLGALASNSQKYQGYISNFRLTVGNCVYGNAGSDGVTGFAPPTVPLTGGTMRALYTSRPFVHSMPYSQQLFATVESTNTSVLTPRLLCEDIDWTEGGLLWMKCMSQSHQHRLYDTERDIRKFIRSDTNAEEIETNGGISHWTAKGASHSRDGDAVFSANPEETAINQKYAAWGFRKAKRFFDVIKYDGNSTSGRKLEHNLKIQPGMILIKRLDIAGDWVIYHRGVGYDGNPPENYKLGFNADTRNTAFSDGWAQTAPTNKEFTIGSDANINLTGGKYVAYLFAHDPEPDSIIKCGGYVGDATHTYVNGRKITLGWEPQYVMIKCVSDSGDWWIYDAQRGGMRVYDKAKMGQATQTGKLLYANTTDDQQGNVYDITPDATGFWHSQPTPLNETGKGYVYIAIRKGPMRTPTDPKKVFSVSRAWGTNTPTYLADFPPDVFWDRGYMSTAYWRTATRKMGYNTSTTGEPRLYWDRDDNCVSDTNYNSTGFTTWDEMKGARYGTLLQQNPYIGHLMRRAPGFFDTVGYVGDASSVDSNVERAIPHNLGVKPEMIVVRTFGNDGMAGAGHPGLHKNCGNLPTASASPYNGVQYNGSKTIITSGNSTGGWYSGTTAKEYFGESTDTATDFYVGTAMGTNKLYYSYMAYLWATCPKISKVGYYVATGTDMNIDCNFDDTARLVIINKWNSGDYYCYDSIRGIVSSNDPFLYWNDGAAQNDNNDYIDPYSSGFSITSSANTTLNVVGHYYQYLAIA